MLNVRRWTEFGQINQRPTNAQILTTVRRRLVPAGGEQNSGNGYRNESHSTHLTAAADRRVRAWGHSQQNDVLTVL